MTIGLIRCVALLRAMGSDPIVPGVGLEPRPPMREEGRAGKGLGILLTSLFLALLCAGAFASDGDPQPAGSAAAMLNHDRG